MQMRTTGVGANHPFFPPAKVWSHIELGAANYGGNSKKKSDNQFNVLFSTIDRLIETKGKKGIFYINDMKQQDIDYVVKCLTQYLEKRHPKNEIQLIALPGSFFDIDLPVVDSIHLKNPEVFLFAMLNDEQYKNRMAYFAEHSREGLTLVTYYKKLFFQQFESLGVGVKVMNENCPPYIDAEGNVVLKFGNVVEFNIKSTEALRWEGLAAQYISSRSSVPLRLLGEENASGVSEMKQEDMSVDVKCVTETGDDDKRSTASYSPVNRGG